METQRVPKRLVVSIFFSLILLGLGHVWQLASPRLDQTLFLTYHTIFGIFSAVFALAIFLTFYFTQEVRNLSYNMILGNSFFLVGALDLLHTMALPGLPFTFSGNPETVAWVWLLSRLLFVIGLLWAFRVGRRATTEFSKEHGLIWSLLILITIVLMSLYGIDALPRLLTLEGALSPLKLGLAGVGLLLYVYAIVRYTEDMQERDTPGRIYFLIGLWLLVFSEVALIIYPKPVDPMTLLGHFFKVAGLGLMFTSVFIKNVRIPYQTLHEQSRELRYSVSDLQSAIEVSTWEIRHQNDLLARANEKLQQDLVATRAIQEAVFPNEGASLGDITFHFEINPLDELSGDFINYYPIDHDHTAFYIMDVAGHGLTSAMLGVLASNAVLESVHRESKDVNKIMPDQVLKQLFNIYNQSAFPDEAHLVMLFGIYHHDSSEVILSTAGLNVRPIVIPRGEAPRYVDIPGGFPISRLAEFVTPVFENYSIPVKAGDKLLLYTDGLLEMKRDDWDEAALLEFVRRHHRDDGETLRTALSELVKELHLDMEQADDISFAILEADVS